MLAPLVSAHTINKMRASRHHQLKPALRGCAVLVLLLWVAAVTFCSLESLVNHSEPGSGGHAHAVAHHDHDRTSADGVPGHPHDSDPSDDQQDACCTTLKAVPQLASSTAVAKPDFGKSVSLSFLWAVQAFTFVQPEPASLRQASPPEWVFTPEVCLGPAFRSLAPPVLL